MTLPSTVSERAGRRRGRGAALAVLVAVIVGAGCAGSGADRRATHAELMSDADMDSLGLAEFVDLPPAERAARRTRAATWLRHAAAAGEAWGRAESLETAAGLAPDDPHVWLDLAETAGWLGDPLRVDGALLNATAALRELNKPGSDLRITRAERDDIVVRTCLLRCWFHYGRAEWHEGLGWARAALQVRPGALQIVIVKGLLEAGAQQRAQAEIAAEELGRHEPYRGCYGWITSMVELAYGNDVLAWARRGWGPEELATEFWRDRGRVCEAVAEWDDARRAYAESGAALHASSARYRRRVDHARLGDPLDAETMPVWLALDRYYLTGSLSAYTALVFERFDTAVTPERRTLWGGETVNAAGILLRRGEQEARACRVRGLVFLDRGNLDRARADLERAARLFAERGGEDPRVTAGLGRLWLRREDHKQALPHLERAVLLAPTDPDVWSDLGLVRVMADDEEGAAAAFGRAIELDPEAVTAWYNRGLMRLHAGELDAAAADLGEAARLAPDNAEVARLLQRIRVMQRDGAPGE